MAERNPNPVRGWGLEGEKVGLDGGEPIVKEDQNSLLDAREQRGRRVNSSQGNGKDPRERAVKTEA